MKKLYVGHEAAVRIDGDVMDWFPVPTGVCHGCLMSPARRNFYSEEIVQVSAELSWIAVTIYGRQLNTFHCADNTLLVILYVTRVGTETVT